MTSVTVELPSALVNVLDADDEPLATELLLAAVCQWYAEGRISQGLAAEITNLSREAFIDELGRRGVSVLQETADEVLRPLG